MDKELECQFKAINDRMDDLEDRLGAEVVVAIRKCEELMNELSAIWEEERNRQFSSGGEI